MSVIQAGNTVTTSVVITGDTTGNVVFTSGTGNTVTLTIPSSGGIKFADNTTQTTAAASAFPAGTKMLFVQTAAPTGWTKDTTYNNYALRIVSGTAGTGGSVAFTTAFASQTPTGTIGTSGATTITTAQMPSHLHGYYTAYYLNSGPGFDGGALAGGSNFGSAYNNYQAIPPQNTGNTGGDGSHTHAGGTFTGSAINLAVQYVDAIICTKS